MKYEKAKVNIINLGNEDILTCSGELGHNDCNISITGSGRTSWYVGTQQGSFSGVFNWFFSIFKM